MTETDQVKGPVEEPNPIGVHPAPGLFLPAHGIIHDLDRFPVDRRIIYPVQNLLEFAVFLVRLQTKVKRLLDIFQIFDTGGRVVLTFWKSDSNES